MKTPTYHLIQAYAQLSKDWEKVLEIVRTVDIVPAKTVPISLKGIRAKKQECYLNALAVCMKNPQAKYVEGFIEVHGVPIEHAWNSIDGQHFDVTEEKLQSSLHCPHRAVMEIDSVELLEFAVLNQISGPYLKQWLVKQ